MNDTSKYSKDEKGPTSLFEENVLEDFMDYAEIIKTHQWIVSDNHDCIISPDCDGFLCGLLLTTLLNWRIVGVYDGKALAIKDGIDYHDCIFMDCEVNRAGVKSIGNHLLEYNRRIQLSNHNFGCCINPNLLRGFDGKESFQRKYPFGTIHLLLSLLQGGGKLASGDICPQAIAPLLFADGVCNNLFGYPENCLDWIHYLGASNKSHILNILLCNSNFTFYTAMNELENFFKVRDQYNACGFFDGNLFVEGGRNKRSGHQLKITNTKGQIINIVNRNGLYEIHINEAERIKGFINELSSLTGWSYQSSKWNCWDELQVTAFSKDMLSNNGTRLNNKTYEDLFLKNPFSLAMTAGDRIEYSIEV
ncbi:hypothetical protein [Candidatus Mycalebacterium sp.]